MYLGTIIEFFIRCIVLISAKIVEAFALMLSVPYFFEKIKRCPVIKDEIIFTPAYTLAEKIRKRELSSETVINAYINRIKEVDPILNAVVEDRFQAALEEAKHVDDMLSKTNLNIIELGQQYPLLGLPLTVKESIAVKGMSNCAGKVFPGGRRAMKDAEIIKMCKDAGAIPLVVTNTPELCINFETYNSIIGRTRNPYDTRRTPGGSSGGEGALLAAGASVIGLGSDIYGSVRLPAHYCGVWAHKPSPNIVSVNGHYPDCKHEKEWNEVFNLGPMCRYAGDLHLLMNVILKKRYTSLIQLDKEVHLPNIKIYYIEDDSGSMLIHPVDNEILSALRRVVSHMASKYGCRVQHLQIKEFKYSTEMSLAKLYSINDIEPIFNNNGEQSIKELFRYLTFQSKSFLMPIISGIIKYTWNYVPKTITKQLSTVEAGFKTNLCQTLGNDGILICPSHPSTAPMHNQGFGRLLDYSYLGIFNCLGLPVTNCPLGLSTEGLPVSVQVVAAPNNDRLTLAVAKEIETAFGGWVPPTFTTALTK